MEIIGAIIALIIHGALSSVASDFASYKGFSKRAWFHTCFWLPPIGYLMVIAMPDMELHRQNEDMIELQKLLVAVNGGKRTPPADADVPEPFTK